MVQEFHVIRCFSCETFQVHQVKKSNKWNCKLCGAKQSVRKEYGRGSGADCRRHVQKLNMMRATLDSAPPPSDDQEVSQQEWQKITEDSTDPQYDYTDDGQKPSKWEKFVASTDKTDDNQYPSDPEDPQFTTDKNRFQQRKKKGKGQSSHSYDRPGKRQRCQGAVPDVPARPSFVQTCATDWQLPTAEQENSPTFHEQRGYSNMNTSHNLWYRRQHHENNIGGNTEPQPTAVHTTWQQKVHATNLTRKIQNQDFTDLEGNTERESTAQPRWQHSHTTNMTHSKVALSETSKIKLEEREEVEFRNEEIWKDVDTNDDDRSVDRQMPNLARKEQKGQRSLPSSSGSSSRWSRFTRKAVDDDDDEEEEAQQVHVESYGSNQPNDSSSSKCDLLSAQFTANDGNVERDRSLKEALSYYSDDPAIEKCHHPMTAKPCSDPQGDVQTRMTGDVQTCGEVSELRTGFCTGEDLDEVLGDDIWDL